MEMAQMLSFQPEKKIPSTGQAEMTIWGTRPPNIIQPFITNKSDLFFYMSKVRVQTHCKGALNF